MLLHKKLSTKLNMTCMSKYLLCNIWSTPEYDTHCKYANLDTVECFIKDCYNIEPEWPTDVVHISFDLSVGTNKTISEVKNHYRQIFYSAYLND